ncbi:MAG: hypothetical protein PHE17_18165 [Thiothrix sp.]|uniref:hypothetical protein n=1 Tax=Thiothrix sp. TaxID=1032 RepID=UPI0026081D37|nr:hypothetical protein [Thiothrix sp.]MDD5394947.1 hypothetical protein [Thiothrix sp.]
MKIFDFLRQSLPNEPGYQDELKVLESGPLSPEKIIMAGLPCSTWPNPTRPADGVPYYAAYAGVELGQYAARCVQHPEYGKCLLLNNGETLPSVWPNSNHEWQFILNGVYFHPGGLHSSPEWRGSRGCFTAPADAHARAMSAVELLEDVTVIVRGTRLYLGLHA